MDLIISDPVSKHFNASRKLSLFSTSYLHCTIKLSLMLEAWPSPCVHLPSNLQTLLFTTCTKPGPLHHPSTQRSCEAPARLMPRVQFVPPTLHKVAQPEDKASELVTDSGILDFCLFKDIQSFGEYPWKVTQPEIHNSFNLPYLGFKESATKKQSWSVNTGDPTSSSLSESAV